MSNCTPSIYHTLSTVQGHAVAQCFWLCVYFQSFECVLCPFTKIKAHVEIWRSKTEGLEGRWDGVQESFWKEVLRLMTPRLQTQDVQTKLFKLLMVCAFWVEKASCEIKKWCHRHTQSRTCCKTLKSSIIQEPNGTWIRHKSIWDCVRPKAGPTPLQEHTRQTTYIKIPLASEREPVFISVCRVSVHIPVGERVKI